MVPGGTFYLNLLIGVVVGYNFFKRWIKVRTYKIRMKFKFNYDFIFNVLLNVTLKYTIIMTYYE